MTDYKTQISVLEAISLTESQASKLEPETLPLQQCYGRTLATDLTSKVAHPSLDNSALDGYACRAADLLTATREQPVSLKVIGDVPAGSVFNGSVGPGEAVSIYTGAPVPSGTDAILRVEDTTRQTDTVLCFAPADAGAVRRRGQDFAAGVSLIKAGTVLNAASVGVAAATGYGELSVTRQPRVAILATGDEVIEPGEAIRDGQVFNSNSYSVAGLVRAAGAVPIILPRMEDDKSRLEQAFKEAGTPDLLLTSGGVSMGNYDFVRDLLFENGEVYFWKVAMKPAGPVLFGRWQNMPVLGLPGNPVSSMVAFLILARAFIRKQLGQNSPLPYQARQTAVTDVSLKSAGFKETFIRLVMAQEEDGHLHVNTTGSQNSGVLTSMLYANALAVVPPHTQYKVGDKLEVIPLTPYL